MKRLFHFIIFNQIFVRRKTYLLFLTMLSVPTIANCPIDLTSVLFIYLAFTTQISTWYIAKMWYVLVVNNFLRKETWAKSKQIVFLIAKEYFLRMTFVWYQVFAIIPPNAFSMKHFIEKDATLIETCHIVFSPYEYRAHCLLFSFLN